MMLTSIHIQGFKNFKDTKIEPLRKVNLILGGQNVGKTSLLEAVYSCTCSKEDKDKTPTLFRSSEGKDSIRYIEYIDEDYDIKLNGVSIKDYSPSEEDWDYKISPFVISTNLPSQSAFCKLFDNVVLHRNKKILIEMLKQIEPRLEDIHNIAPDEEHRIYIELNGIDKAIPLPQFGHGFNRLFSMYCGLLQNMSKLVLIDEIENGIYFNALPILFKGINNISGDNDIQSLITTHSWECICAAYNIFAEAGRLEDFQLIRLEQEGDNVRAVLINDEDLDTIMEAGHEIR